MHIRWYGENLWLFVPVQAKLMEFLGTVEGFPFQEGSSLNAAGVIATRSRPRACSSG